MSGFWMVLPLDHPSVSPRGNIVENPQVDSGSPSGCMLAFKSLKSYMSIQTITFDSNGFHSFQLSYLAKGP